MIYVCEYCKKQFETQKECLQCEYKHNENRKIKKLRDLRKKLADVLEEIQNEKIELVHFKHHDNGSGSSGYSGDFMTNNEDKKIISVVVDEEHYRIDINSFRHGERY